MGVRSVGPSGPGNRRFLNTFADDVPDMKDNNIYENSMSTVPQRRRSTPQCESLDTKHSAERLATARYTKHPLPIPSKVVMRVFSVLDLRFAANDLLSNLVSFWYQTRAERLW